jgi:membrane protease YdiL (CAAX protease family)
MAAATTAEADSIDAPARSDAWTDLGLTLPVFVLYHLGVATLPMRNAADWVSAELHALARHSLAQYVGLTLGIGLAFAAVVLLFGKREALSTRRFLWIAVEGALYAVLMRAAGAYAVGSLRLARVRASRLAFDASPQPPGSSVAPSAEMVDPSLSDQALSALTQLGWEPAAHTHQGVTMALGAGFYEELAFRVALFGLGALCLRQWIGKGAELAIFGWAIASACVFAGWHYLGPMGDPWDVRTFVFRAVCGLVLTAIYQLRGFAPAVWTHALYDVWALG